MCDCVGKRRDRTILEEGVLTLGNSDPMMNEREREGRRERCRVVVS